MVNVRIDVGRALVGLKKIQPLTQKSMKELIQQQTKLFMDDRKTGVIALTPPSSPGVTGNKAKIQGETAILRDLLGGRQASVSGARFAGVFLVMSDALIKQATTLNTGNVRLWVTKTGEVYGTETKMFFPNASISQMRQHHKRYYKNGRMSQAGGRTRDVGRWKFIDRMVVSSSAFNRYLKFMKKRVGMLAGGWSSAANKFNARVPAWIKRHADKSSYRETDTNTKYYVRLTSSVGFDSKGVARRARMALKYRQSALKRRMPYLIRAANKKAMRT